MSDCTKEAGPKSGEMVVCQSQDTPHRMGMFCRGARVPATVKIEFDAPPEAIEEFKALLRKHGVDFTATPK